MGFMRAHDGDINESKCPFPKGIKAVAQDQEIAGKLYVGTKEGIQIIQVESVDKNKLTCEDHGFIPVKGFDPIKMENFKDYLISFNSNYGQDGEFMVFNLTEARRSGGDSFSLVPQSTFTIENFQPTNETVLPSYDLIKKPSGYDMVIQVPGTKDQVLHF